MLDSLSIRAKLLALLLALALIPMLALAIFARSRAVGLLDEQAHSALQTQL